MSDLGEIRLVLAGVASFPDVDGLTVFADNLIPHVLRLDGALVYASELAELVDSGRELPAAGRWSARSAPARYTRAS